MRQKCGVDQRGLNHTKKGKESIYKIYINSKSIYMSYVLAVYEEGIYKIKYIVLYNLPRI